MNLDSVEYVTVERPGVQDRPSPDGVQESARRPQIPVFVAVIQLLLFLVHWFLYQTWVAFWGAPESSDLPAALAFLSVSFVAASLLAWRSSHVLVRVFYTLSAVWLGIVSFCFLAACSGWVLYGVARFLGLPFEGRVLAAGLLGLALLASLYGMVNAAWLRVNRISVKLPNLPESWRGRVAALVSDIHLGHVRGHRFVRRIVTVLARLRPDIVFIAGDLYDGTAADIHRLADPGKIFQLLRERSLLPEITRSSPTTRSTSTLQKARAFASSTTRSWKSMACRSLECTIVTRSMLCASGRSSGKPTWIATAPASCSPMRRTAYRLPRKKASRCSSLAIPIEVSSSPLPG